MRIVIVEDGLADMYKLRSYLERYLVVRDISADIETYQTAAAFLSHPTASKYDIALLDCYLDKAGLTRDPHAKNGIDIAHAIRAVDDQCKIIFETNTRDFAVESYDVRASGYLMKPVDYKQLADTLDRIGINSTSPRMIELGGGFAFDVNQLLWVRSDAHYLELFLRESEPIRIRYTFSQLVKDLGDYPQFFSPARGYLVNLDVVERIDNNDLVLYGGTRISISRRKLTATRDKWSQWIAYTYDDGGGQGAGSLP